jgi:hypothetical protein
MDTLGANFEPLIIALQAANRVPDASLEQQLHIIELCLVGLELDPDVIQAVQMFYSIKVLKGLDLDARSKAIGTRENSDLAAWF